MKRIKKWESLDSLRSSWPLQYWLGTKSVYKYSARRLMGSRIIESAAYCNQILLSQVFISIAQNKSVN
jgi:hypothetical protein